MNKNINENTRGDVLHASIKGVLGVIPFVGSLASELFNLVISPPLERRKAEWMDDVSLRLASLEREGAIKVSELVQNDLFVDAFLQASSIAIKTSERVKIEACQNAVVNVALCHYDEPFHIQVFMSQLERFTVWHILILNFVNDIPRWFALNKRKQLKTTKVTIATMLKEAYPQLETNNDLIKLAWNELHASGMVRVETMGVPVNSTGDRIFERASSELGRKFIDFINDSSDNK